MAKLIDLSKLSAVRCKLSLPWALLLARLHNASRVMCSPPRTVIRLSAVNEALETIMPGISNADACRPVSGPRRCHGNQAYLDVRPDVALSACSPF
jgi:hypothetical protein